MTIPETPEAPEAPQAPAENQVQDAALIHAVAHGPSACRGEALAELIARHDRVLQAHVRAIVRDTSAAEDLIQETFLVVWQRAGQFRGEHTGSAAAWLRQIATHRALNYLRTARRRPPTSAPTLPNSPSGTPPDWDNDIDIDVWDQTIDPFADETLEQAEADEIERRLRAALDTLPERQQRVHRMVADGLELRAIAKELGIPIGTAKSRLHYARLRLNQTWQRLARQWEDL